jgi:hypothetical protein
MSSATETELAGIYIMAHKAIFVRIILEELGHTQPPTPPMLAMADAVINDMVQLKQTNANDMRFHWIGHCECEQQFRINLRPVMMNFLDCWTKHHPKSYHHVQRTSHTAHHS